MEPELSIFWAIKALAAFLTAGLLLFTTLLTISAVTGYSVRDITIATKDVIASVFPNELTPPLVDQPTTVAPRPATSPYVPHQYSQPQEAKRPSVSDGRVVQESAPPARPRPADNTIQPPYYDPQGCMVFVGQRHC